MRVITATLFERIWPGLAAVALLLLLAGCGDSGDRSSTESSTSDGSPRSGNDANPVAVPAANGAPNELLPVKATAISREERPVSYAREGLGQSSTSSLALESSAERTAADREAAKRSPGAAGWDSERLSDLASEQLGRLKQPVSDIDFDSLLADGFECSALVVSGLQYSELQGRIRIARAPSDALGIPGRTLEHEVSNLREALGGDPHIRIKPIGVLLGVSGEDEFETTVLVEAVGRQASGNESQINAEWSCAWKVGDDELPRLRRIALKDYREVHTTGPLFEDATLSAFARAPSFSAQMMHGTGFWAQRLTRIDDMTMTGHQGLALGDVNGDGLDDLYVCDGGGLPNRLYVQLPDGSVEDRSAAAQVDFLEDSRSALLIDLDGDADQDLVVATVALVLFAENDGSGVFSLKGGHQGAPSPFTMAAADYDSDGDLDLYVTSYGQGRDASSGAQGFEARSPIPYNDANNGGRNVLIANHGGFHFSEVTKDVGLEQNNTRWSFSAAWEDFDRDGDPDLYVANDFGRNNFYRNDGGKFRDIAAGAAVEDMAGGMSVSWGDGNGDGRPDIYVGNMYSAAGNRVTYQRKFSGARKAGDTAAMQRMARGNTLFQRGDGGAFEDISERAGVTMGRWAWSSGFVDLNNDGREDLVIANGYLSNPATEDL